MTSDRMHESKLHVVLGAGPLGLAVARHLAARGDRVRAAVRTDAPTCRKGLRSSGPTSRLRPTRGGRVRGQPSSTTVPTRRTRSGRICTPAHGRRHRGRPLLGPRLVFGDNLYSYGPVHGPLTEDLPYLAPGPNGRTRAQITETLLRAHASGRIRAAIGRGSDFFGPHAHCRRSVIGSSPKRSRGRRLQVLGNPDLPHTVTYIEDFAERSSRSGSTTRPWGRCGVPNAETVTIRTIVQLVFQSAGHPSRLRAAPRWGIAMAALFNPTMRAVKEQLYRSERPWVVDSTKFERTFGWTATPLPDAVAATVAWFQDQMAE